MAAIPFAFSAHHFISTVGSDAGFAAIIGLAILALLFFSQARETSSLRERAAESEDQVRRLAAYVDQLSRSSGDSTPAPRTAPAPALSRAPGASSASAVADPAPAAARAGIPAARAGIPAAPAGVGAPALSAATRLIPGSEADQISIRSMAPARAGAGALTGAAVMAPPSPPPSTAAAAGNGGGSRTPAGATGDQPPPRMAIRRSDAPPAARPSVSPPRRGGPQAGPGRSRIGRGAIALATVLVAAIIVVGLLVLTTSSSSSSQSTSSTQASNSASKRSSGPHRTVAVAPSAITVAVLNGTSTSNLAHDVATKLAAARFKQGNVATASDQTLTATIVGYLPGHRQDALVVAKSLKLGPASVQAVDPSNRAVACSGSTAACSAQVVVTVGSDLASLA